MPAGRSSFGAPSPPRAEGEAVSETPCTHPKASGPVLVNLGTMVREILWSCPDCGAEWTETEYPKGTVKP